MQPVVEILKRELKDYFISPIAYIIISIFLLITGWLFFSTFFLVNQAEMRNFFSLLPITFSFVIPAITMRLYSEELKSGSYEILVTLPVDTKDIVLGKFLAGSLIIGAALLPTISYPIWISFIGELDWGPIIGGYIGAMMLAMAFSAIGIFASSLTHNQIIAFIVGMVICLSLTLIDKMLFFLPNYIVGFFQYIGADFHFRNISKGVIDSRDILYFLSVAFIGLFSTNLAMQEKK